eukprot:scaffold2972_cov48-Attheya_sp.AAC.2
MTKKKKSRKNKQNNQGHAAASTANGSAPDASSAPPLILGGVDAEGRMHENQLWRFYGLLQVLAAMALPKLNAERASAPGSEKNTAPLQWNSSDLTANSADTVEMVMHYSLQEIDWLVDQVEKNATDRRNQAIIQQCLGRRMSKGEKEEIQSFQVHVKDDFFVLGHIPGKGAVLVQVGRLRHQEPLPHNMIQDEYHEPRVFVVQGLVDSLSSLTAPIRAHFQKEHPSLLKKYPEFEDSLCRVHTTLLPYNNGIIFMLTIGGPQTNHYSTPQDLAAAMDKAVDAYRQAFPDDSLNSNSKMNSSTSVALFHSLDPVKDESICRLTSRARNQNMLGVARRECPMRAELKKQASTTPIKVTMRFWQPYQDTSHPRYDKMIEQATIGIGDGEDNNSKPFLLEGVRNMENEEVLVDDHDPCPFHRIFGEQCSSFADCCKSEYLRRVAKATQNSNVMKMCLIYNPVGRAEAEKKEALAVSTGENTIVLSALLRIGYPDKGVVKLKVSPPFTRIIKKRMDSCQRFHSSREYKWMYWGHMPLNMGEMGVMTFGDITLDPDTGVFEARDQTAERLTLLIAEMKYVCVDMFILEASLEMQPAYKMKPDPVAFEKNKALLQDGLHWVAVHASINKEINEGFVLKCGFCGTFEELEEDGSPLLMCACKYIFYCCKKHQRRHWPDHKAECNRIRGETVIRK